MKHCTCEGYGYLIGGLDALEATDVQQADKKCHPYITVRARPTHESEVMRPSTGLKKGAAVSQLTASASIRTPLADVGASAWAGSRESNVLTRLPHQTEMITWDWEALEANLTNMCSTSFRVAYTSQSTCDDNERRDDYR